VPEDRLIERALEPGLEVADQHRVDEHAVALLALHIAVPLEDDRVHRERPRLVRTQDVHGAEVLNRIEALDDHALARHRHGPFGETHGHDHGQHLGREPNRHRQGEEERAVPIVLRQAVDQEDDWHHDGDEPDHQPREAVDPAVERRLGRGLRDAARHGAEQGPAAGLDDDGLGRSGLHTRAQEAQVRPLEWGLIGHTGQRVPFLHRQRLAGEARLADEEVLGAEEAHIRGDHVPGGEQDDVPRDDLAQRHLARLAVAQRRRRHADQGA
jgi:hypothetical protein